MEGKTIGARPQSNHGQRRAERPDLGIDRERQREEFGGFNIGAAFFGWLVAVGMAALLTRSSVPRVPRSA